MRGGAALLDALVAYAIVLVVSWAWMFVTDAEYTGHEQTAPGYVSAGITGLVMLYLTATVAGGGTWGMRAVGLRVCRVEDAAPPGPARAAARSLVLVAAVCGLWQIHPVLVGAYVLLVLVLPGGRLPHDLVAGTVVVRAASSAVPGAGIPVSTVRPDLNPAEARAVLADLEALQRRSAKDLHRASVPLIVLGVTVLVAAVVDLQAFGDLFFLPWLYWTVAGPLGLVVAAGWYRRIRLRDGVAPGEGDILVIAALTGCAALAGAFLWLGGAVTACGFLALGLTRRIRILAVAAALSGVVMAVEEPFRALSNALVNAYPGLPMAHLLGQHGPTAVLAPLGLALATAGGLILRREQAGTR